MRPSMKVNAPPPMKLSARVVGEVVDMEEVEVEVVAMEEVEVEVVEEVSLNMGGGREMLMVEEVMVVEVEAVASEEEASEEVALEGVAVQVEAIQLLQVEGEVVEVATQLLQVEEEEVEVATQHRQEATQHPRGVAEVAIPPPWGGGSLFPPFS